MNSWRANKMSKKSFNLNENPAIRFISSANDSDTQPSNDSTKNNHLPIESKSRRVQLLIRPSLYDKLKATADRQQLSVNEMINQILNNTL